MKLVPRRSVQILIVVVACSTLGWFWRDLLVWWFDTEAMGPLW